MKIMVVVAHPRKESLCSGIFRAIISQLESLGHEVDCCDLYDEQFDACLRVEDEPDWDNPGKIYSDAVINYQARIVISDSLVLVFPIWWWSFPAILKGWIDRVWNNGWAYGSKKIPVSSVLVFSTASATSDTYSAEGYKDAIDQQIGKGIFEYCGIKDYSLNIYYDILSSDDGLNNILNDVINIINGKFA
ncbi:NAD(P)H dehydrogenase (quinone) [Acidithiobacillus ferrivorans SS3]|uniref:NAD(P)H dehydrogenase (Quinone) n=1 Tax=Acidithiobacillus ferrivorans SS3 TaxID=743299 RepID=G0JP42_9PROT|nr:NAD(P)H oxidoreductase [Acidithiobacillus ferrivorans]AEM48457.1 NAD(P)H dehydrogenase (quinone) [Acidithiobacillus ferrivorans SS3]